MSSEGDSSPRVGREQLVKVAQERLYTARERYYRDMLDRGHVSEQTRRELIQAAMEYRSELVQYADESIVEEDWDESGIEWLADLLHETTTVPKEAPGRTSNPERTTRPAVMAVDPSYILEVTHELDHIAKKLGLGLNVTQSEPRTEITEEDMEKLEEWREANLE